MKYATKDRLWQEVRNAFGVPPHRLRQSEIGFVIPGIQSGERMFQGTCVGVRCSEASGAVLTVWIGEGECEVRPEQVREIAI